MSSQSKILRTNQRVRSGGLRRRRGGAVLELAICGVLLSMIVFGAVEGGAYFYIKGVMTNAAREGCRNGILGYQAGSATGGNPPDGSAASMNAVIEDQLVAGGLVASGTAITASTPNWTIGSYTVSFYDYNLSTGAQIQQVSDPHTSTMAVGDGLLVKIVANWSTIGGNFRPMRLLSGTGLSNGVTCMMRKEAL